MSPLVIEAAAIRPVSLPLASPRAIARGVETHAHLVEVTVAGAGAEGRGQACPMPRYGESVESVLAAFEAVRPSLLALNSRQALLDALPAG
ncbi:MAG TPA: dipeptide epimerase, partial [Caulobacteraceae bacterium]|nr:dipeptide epimerase [Caulobacteraceae bacterium]